MTDTFRLFIHAIPDRALGNAVLSAQQSGRFPVTALWLYQNPDEQGYMYNASHDYFGLDPWTVVSGVDSVLKTGDIILEHGTIGEKIVDPSFIVYVQR